MPMLRGGQLKRKKFNIILKHDHHVDYIHVYVYILDSEVFIPYRNCVLLP